MTTIRKFNIEPISPELIEALQHKVNSKTKPLGALGRLEEIAIRIGLIQQTLTPRLQNPALAIFAGDHGIAAEGVISAYPQAVTRQMVCNFLDGGAAVNVFCRQHNIKTYVVDAGVAHDFDGHPELTDLKVGKGTRNFRFEPAMSRSQCLEAIGKGAQMVDKLHNRGTNILGIGEMGIGNTSSASIITSLITGEPIGRCVGKGTGLDKKGTLRKTEVLKEAMKHHAVARDPLSILTTFGGFEIAMMVGAVLQAAGHRMTVIDDGFIVTAALLIASELNPIIKDYTLFAHVSGEQGHQIQLKYLRAQPLLDLGMRLGEGTGAAVAFPVIASAVRFLNEMASFESAGISRGDIHEK